MVIFIISGRGLSLENPDNMFRYPICARLPPCEM